MKCFKCQARLFLGPLAASETRDCSACGRLLLSASKHGFSCPNCPAVAFCKHCRVCTRGHNMKKCVVLMNKSGPYYSGFKCDVCGSNGVMVPQGVWHCTDCEFDICSKCEFEKN